MIENLAIPSPDLFKLLKRKGVEYLHHANTVATSLSFIEQNALASRKYFKDRQITQTPQRTDEQDQLHEVWDSVFLDGTDHHELYKGRNVYGPVLFKLQSELLLDPDLPTVHITKYNPTRWGNTPAPELHYYPNIDEVEKDYLTGVKLDSQIMFTFRSPERKVDLTKYLNSIVLDDPKLKFPSGSEKKEGRDVLLPVFSAALQKSGLGHIPLSLRATHKCPCYGQYERMFKDDPENFKRLFGRKLP